MARLFVLLLLVFPSALFAQPKCGERAKVVQMLAEKYGESHLGSGLQSPTQMIEIWTNGATGTFTILLTRASGISCIMSSGKYWDSFDLKPEGVLQSGPSRRQLPGSLHAYAGSISNSREPRFTRPIKLRHC